MNVAKLIMKNLREKGEIKTSDIVRATGFTRAYINRFLQELRGSRLIAFILFRARLIDLREVQESRGARSIVCRRFSSRLIVLRRGRGIKSMVRNSLLDRSRDVKYEHSLSG